MSTGIDPYRDHCTVRVRVFLRNNGRQGRIDGPPTAGQNDYQELMMRPDKHDDFQLVGVYDLTGSYIPFFPFDLNGQVRAIKIIDAALIEIIDGKFVS
jgi:hypothetical protein